RRARNAASIVMGCSITGRSTWPARHLSMTVWVADFSSMTRPGTTGFTSWTWPLSQPKRASGAGRRNSPSIWAITAATFAGGRRSDPWAGPWGWTTIGSRKSAGAIVYVEPWAVRTRPLSMSAWVSFWSCARSLALTAGATAVSTTGVVV